MPLEHELWAAALPWTRCGGLIRAIKIAANDKHSNYAKLAGVGAVGH